MATEQWSKAVSRCLVVSSVLQLFAFITPGWFVYSRDGESQYHGLLYIIKCGKAPGSCSTYPIVEWYQFFLRLNAQVKYRLITDIFRVIIPLILCSAICVLEWFPIRKEFKFDHKIPSIVCLVISNTLQWIEVSDMANISVVHRKNADFPWGLFGYVIGSCLTSAAAVMTLRLWWTEQNRLEVRNDALLMQGNRATEQEVRHW